MVNNAVLDFGGYTDWQKKSQGFADSSLLKSLNGKLLSVTSTLAALMSVDANGFSYFLVLLFCARVRFGHKVKVLISNLIFHLRRLNFLTFDKTIQGAF